MGKFTFAGNGKAIAMGEDQGLVKTVFDARSGELLGAHIIHPEASELITGYGVATALEATEEDLMHTVFAHPTLSETLHESVLAAFGGRCTAERGRPMTRDQSQAGASPSGDTSLPSGRASAAMRAMSSADSANRTRAHWLGAVALQGLGQRHHVVLLHQPAQRDLRRRLAQRAAISPITGSVSTLPSAMPK